MSRNGFRRPGLTVLHCRSSSTRHGPEQALDQLVRTLRDQGIEPHVLALYRRPDGGPIQHPWVAAARASGVQAVQVHDPGPLSIRVIRHMARGVRQSGADVLHTHDYKTNIVGGLVARRSERSLPWVATVHLHTTTTRRLKLYRALDLFLLRLADRVVTVSRDQRRLLLRRGVDRRRLVLVPNVIDADAFASGAGDPAETRAGLGLRPDVPLVALVGRLTAQKGVDCFLEAANHVRHECPAARFIVAGRGSDLEELRALAADLGVGGVVDFLGYRDDIASLLAASDVVVLPSRSEGLPLVLLEAMALDRPVVASSVGGVPDLLQHERTGMLVPPESPGEVAEAIRLLLSDPQMALRIGTEGGRHVRAYHAPERAARRLAAVYRTVLAERA